MQISKLLWMLYVPSIWLMSCCADKYLVCQRLYNIWLSSKWRFPDYLVKSIQSVIHNTMTIGVIICFIHDARYRLSECKNHLIPTIIYDQRQRNHFLPYILPLFCVHRIACVSLLILFLQISERGLVSSITTIDFGHEQP